jgi:branched-chain amino acid transport system ATP-binding protein
MSRGDTLLSCRGVQAGYGRSQVLFGIDLDIAAGEVVGLLGRNGMGKSTTVKTVLGQLKPLNGEVHFDGHRIDGQASDAIARLGVAVVPEGRQCFPNLTVREHLQAFYRKPRPGASASTHWSVDSLFRLFPRLAERQKNFGNQLSGGEQQMLAIARALSTQPRLLILDEATEGLAPLIREEIWRCLALLRREGQTTLVIDKYVDRLIRLADHHIIVEKGRVAWQGTSSALDADRTLWSRYLSL